VQVQARQSWNRRAASRYSASLPHQELASTSARTRKGHASRSLLRNTRCRRCAREPHQEPHWWLAVASSRVSWFEYNNTHTPPCSLSIYVLWDSRRTLPFRPRLLNLGLNPSTPNTLSRVHASLARLPISLLTVLPDRSGLSSLPVKVWHIAAALPLNSIRPIPRPHHVLGNRLFYADDSATPLSDSNVNQVRAHKYLDLFFSRTVVSPYPSSTGPEIALV
jgi:hypothetical protein